MSEDVDIYFKILELVKSKNPPTVEKLITLAEKELNISQDMVLKYVIELENQEKLKLFLPPELVPSKLRTYLFSTHATWFWIIITLSITTIITVFIIPEKAVPYVYVRHILGSIFVFFLPGFSLIKTLFPTREINSIERIALSIGVSLTIVPLIGFLLINTPWGIKLIPITLSLLALTVFLTITGLLREYYTRA